MDNMNLTPAEKAIIGRIAGNIKDIIELLGEDPGRDGLRKTPMRAARALYFATQGYRETPQSILSQAVFKHDGSGLIIVRDIEFYSMCEHHILPFFGTVSIGYVPGENIIGISKLARLVNLYARRLQIQERLTAQICTTLYEKLGCKGVIVTCNAQHLCMKMRGVEKQNASTTTVDTIGCMDDADWQRRFYDSMR